GFPGFQQTLSIPIHLWVFLITILYSCLATLIVLLMCYPIGYCLAKVLPPSQLPTYLLLLVIPLWVSELMRSFAWYIILSLKGPLTIVLQTLGIITDPIHWTWGLNGYSGIIVGLIYTYILFMLFPIYNAMTTLDSNQIEAAEDLGAGIFKKHWRIIMPHCKPGIASGCVTVFMLCAGSLLVPSLLASPKSRWFTEVIQQWMFESQDWNTGAAYAFILLFICTAFVTLMMRLFKVGFADIAK
ncbi:MAG: ABC transporter permease, partial [Aestuariivirga sp.]